MRFIRFIVSFIIMAAIVICVLPTLLSYSFCKPFIEKKLSHMLQGEVQFSQLHLSWFTSQSIEEFNYKSSSGAYSVHLKRLSLSSTLFKYLITPHLSQLSTIAVTEITSPALYINNRIASPSSRSKLPPLILLLMQNLSISDGMLVSKEPQEAELRNINLQLKLQGNTLARFSMQGLSLVGEKQGHFDVHYVASNHHIPETLHILLDQFPLVTIDALLSEPGLCASILGPTLNAELTLNQTDTTPLLSLIAKADHLKTSLSARITNQSLSLTKPASLTLTLTPQTFEHIHKMFALKHSLCMTRSASLQLALNTLEIPLLDLKNLAYQAKIETSPLALTWCNTTQPISINAFSLSSSTKNVSESIDCALQSSFNYVLKNPSQVSAKLQLNHPFSQELIDSISNLSVDILKFPMLLLDTSLNLDHTLVDALGETVSAHIAPNREVSKTYIAELDCPRMQIPELRFALKEGIVLTHPTTFTYVPNQDWIVKNLDSKHLTFSKTGKLYGTLETLSLPANPSKGRFLLTCSLNSDDIALHTSMLNGLITLKNTTVSLQNTDHNLFDVRTSTSALYFDDLIPERELFGSPLKIELGTKLDLAHIKQTALSQIECLIQNNKSKISALASLEDHFTKLTFLEPITLEFTPTAADIAQWTKIDYPSLSFVFAPLSATVNLAPLSLNQPLFQQLAFTAEAAITRVDLVDKVFLRDFAFSNFHTQIALNAPQKSCIGLLESKVASKGTSAGNILCNFSSNGFSSFESLRQMLSTSITCKGISSYLLDTLCSYRNALYVLLGPTFDCSLETKHQDGGLNITVNEMSSQLALSGSCLISQEALTIKEPIQCDLKLSTDSLAALEQIYGPSLENFSLTEHALLHITADHLFWPLHSATPLGPFSLKTFLKELTQHLSQSYFHVVAEADQLSIHSERLNTTTALHHVLLESTKTASTSPLLFQFNSAITEHPSKKKEGACSATMILQVAKDRQGKPMLLSKLDAQLKSFPTLLIDSLFEILDFDGIPPSVLLGQEINATLNTDLENLSGHIDCEINGTDSQGNFNAYLTDGVLKLYKPIRATLNITPELAAFFLDNARISLSLAKNPLQLFISDQGFYFPLDPFDVSKILIRQASINLGKILCNNKGNPMEISGFFKLPHDARNALSLWFAPLEFSLNKGSLYIDRTEVLFNDAYQIAFWGNIDLVKRYVKMVLGLTEQSLRKALGIHGLPKSFVLQIPMTGPIDNVKVNTEVATTRIALLVAKSSGLTEMGGLWGDIVDTMGQFANDQTTVPPAKPPFPWKDALSKYEAEERKATTAHIIK